MFNTSYWSITTWEAVVVTHQLYRFIDWKYLSMPKLITFRGFLENLHFTTQLLLKFVATHFFMCLKVETSFEFLELFLVVNSN